MGKAIYYTRDTEKKKVLLQNDTTSEKYWNTSTESPSEVGPLCARELRVTSKTPDWLPPLKFDP